MKTPPSSSRGTKGWPSGHGEQKVYTVEVPSEPFLLSYVISDVDGLLWDQPERELEGPRAGSHAGTGTATCSLAYTITKPGVYLQGTSSNNPWPLRLVSPQEYRELAAISKAQAERAAEAARKLEEAARELMSAMELEELETTPLAGTHFEGD